MLGIQTINMLSNKIKLVIFDLDGVIVSTDEKHFLSWKEVFLKELNTKIQKEDKNLVRGISRQESLKLLLEKYNIQNIDKDRFELLLENKDKIYKKRICELNPDDVYDNLIDLLEFLKEKNIKVVIGSSSRNAKTILEKLDLNKQFKYIVNLDEVKRSKPAPDIFLNAAKMMKIDPKYCLVIEDAQSGINAAKAANMQVIAYSNERKLYNYNELVNNHKQIIELLK